MGTARLVTEPKADKDISLTVLLVSTFLGLTSHSCFQAHIKVKRVYCMEGERREERGDWGLLLKLYSREELLLFIQPY
jgi:hypothetical protein